MASPGRLFPKPEDLWAKWLEYKADLADRAKAWEKIQYVGKDGKRVFDYPKMPLTLQGFKRYCWSTKVGHVEQYFVNKDKLYGDYIEVCQRIKDEIHEDLMTGALLRVYDPSITARITGLADRTETNTTATVQILNIDPLDDSADHKPAQDSGTP